MSEINVFKYGRLSWRRPIDSIKLIFRRLKWGYQRIVRGYCDYDIWEMDYFLGTLLSDMCFNFADNASGWPDSKFETYEDWVEYLREMGRCFRFTKEEAYPTPALDKWADSISPHDNEWINREDELTQAMREEDKRISSERESYKDKALKMLDYVWFNLWD